MKQIQHQKSLLIEWIEFHRLVGVEHFFIYDTYAGIVSTDNSVQGNIKYTKSNVINDEKNRMRVEMNNNKMKSRRSLKSDNKVENNDKNDKIDKIDKNDKNDKNSINTFNNVDNTNIEAKQSNQAHTLRTILSDYIHLGLVTIIPWHYSECDRVEYSTHNTKYNTDYNGENKGEYKYNRTDSTYKGTDMDSKYKGTDSTYCPPIPAPPLRDVALSSCYTRYIQYLRERYAETSI